LVRTQNSFNGNGNLNDYFHPLTDMPESNDDVLVASYIPGYHSKGKSKKPLPLNKEVTVLCHFANEGMVDLNITYMMGSLTLANNFRHYLTNFTYSPVSFMLPPSEEVTLSYNIILPKYLNEDIRYRIANSVFYEDISTNTRYSNTFQNVTINVYENPSEIDNDTLRGLVMAFLSTIIIGYFSYISCFSSKGKSGSGDGGAYQFRMNNKKYKEKGRY